jgi:hypothetical protein
MALTPTQKKKIRLSISNYCAAAVGNEPRIHYSQARPFRFYDSIGVGNVVLDCSGFVINCFWNAGHDLKVYLADPGGQKYSGWGYTGSMETWLRAHGKRVVEANGYLVGDIAMYDGHTTVCSKAGSKTTSRWTSHGFEGGPIVVALHYRSDLRGCWRHPGLT